MAYIFVKKSFDSEITGKKRGDETLTFKDNAFATMAAAYNSKNIKWQTVDANDNPVNELVFLDNEITSRVFFPTGNVSVLSSETGKMTGSLKVTADVSGGDNSNVVFSNFNKVELLNGKADAFKGGTVKSSATADSSAAAGSITVGKNSKVTTISGYKTVKIVDDNAIVDTVAAENYTAKIKDGAAISHKNSVAGSVTVADDAAVLKDISGYSKVILEDARIGGNITGIANNLELDIVDGKDYIKDDMPNAYTSVAVADKLVWDNGVSGSSTVTKSAEDTGSVKVDESTVAGSISNYTKVTIQNESLVNGVNRFDQTEVIQKKAFKTAKDKVVTLTQSSSKTQTFNGSITIADSKIGVEKIGKFTAADVVGFKTVTMTNSVADDIKASQNDGAWSSSTEKTVYQAADAAILKTQDWRNNAAVKKISSETTDKYAAAGSVTIKLDKNADAKQEYSCSNISGFKNVSITGFENKKHEVIAFAVNGCICKEADNTTTKKDTRIVGTVGSGKDAKTTLSGTFTEKITESATGSVKLADAVVGGNIGGYKNVTLKDSVIGGGNDFQYSSDASVNSNAYRKSVFSTDEKGVITAEVTEKNTCKAVGTFTAEDSAMYGMPIVDFATVKLTNTNINGSNIANDSRNYSKNGSYTYKYNSYADYTADKRTLERYNIEFADKASGSVTIKLDKDLDKDTDYAYGSITGYLNVSVSGYNKDDVNKIVEVDGSIAGGNSFETEQFKNNLTSGVKEFVSVGNVSLTNVVASGSVSGFANASLKDSKVAGNLTGGSVKLQKYDTDEDYEVVKQQVIGAVKMESSSIGGDVSGFKSVNVQKGINSLGAYKGTADNKETITVAKKAVLTVSSLDLQVEDKLTVNGELVITNGVGKDGWNCQFGKIEGKGVVYVNDTVMQEIKGVIANSAVEGKNLGQTSENFKGMAWENVDGSTATAAVWSDLEEDFGGWLGVNTADFKILDFQDSTDCIRFTAAADGMVQIKSNEWGSSDTVVLGDKDGRTLYDGEVDYSGMCTFDVVKGEEYVLCITRKDGNSMSYNISFDGDN